MGQSQLQVDGSQLVNITCTELDIAMPLHSSSLGAYLAEDSVDHVRVLVRLHTYPLGFVDIDFARLDRSLEACARTIWSELSEEIRRHLEMDGVSNIDRLPIDGLQLVGATHCLHHRRQVLANPPSVSIIVPTRDRAMRLRRCLESLEAVDYPNYEIIIVDNAPSTDETARIVRSSTSGRARYVREDRPGCSWARNRGLELAAGEIVAFTDDDARVDPNWLSALVAGFQHAENVGAVTGLIVPDELQTRAQLWFEQQGGLGKGFVYRVYDLDEHRMPDPLYPYTAGVFGGTANAAFRTKTLRSIGGFDPALGAGSLALGGPDLAANFEVITRGFRIVYEPAALVFHTHRQDYQSLKSQVFACGTGLTAFLTKVIWDQPWRIIDIAGRSYDGAKLVFGPGSRKNHGKASDYPAELTRTEWLGMCYGPIAYMRSRRAASRQAKQTTIQE